MYWKVNGKIVRENPNVQENYEEKKKPNWVWIILIVIIVAICLVLLITWLALGKKRGGFKFGKFSD